MHGQQNIKIN